MSSTVFSPLNWECPHCHQSYSSSNKLTFLRGTCQHDVCSDCISQKVNGRGADASSLIVVSCPLAQCRIGIFHVTQNDLSSKKRARNGKSKGMGNSSRGKNVEDLAYAKTHKDEPLGIKHVRVKRERSSQTIVDLYKEEVEEIDAVTSLPGPKVKVEQLSIKKEYEPITPGRAVSIKREKTPPRTISLSKDPNGTHVVTPVPSENHSNLKPLFGVGDEVYAAWWDPQDRKRKGKPSWYPGRVTSFKDIGHNQYGPLRLYDVTFDDGDSIDTLNDYWVFSKKDYLLTTKSHDQRWKHIGVKQIFDMTSSDKWAKMVGWYSIVVDGREETFALLEDAMKAHDAYVVGIHGAQTKRSYLNMPENYPELFEKQQGRQNVEVKLEVEVKQDPKEEDTDDDSRFSKVSGDDVESGRSVVVFPDNKRRRLDSPLIAITDFWAQVADPVDFSRNAFMTKPLFHLNSGIDGRKKQQNIFFCPFIREGVATPGFAPVPPEIASMVPDWSYKQIRDAVYETTYYTPEDRQKGLKKACQVAMWLKDATVGSFVIMRHEFPRCPFTPSRLKGNNGKHIGAVYVIGVITKKILPGSAEEQDIQDNRVSEFNRSFYNIHSFCLVQWKWMGLKAMLAETTKEYIKAVCQPTINRMCQDPQKVFSSGATGEEIRRNLWENATMPISPGDFHDIFDVDNIAHY